MVTRVAAVAFLAGTSLLTAGAWMAWRPAGPIVLGVVLLAVSVDALRPPRGEG